ncbi:MAG TPA: hypothetical protein VK453_25260 [Micromonosporaceae bacterium]|nr:hypothetical protein [Micromonosporaceae bacterium]
MSSTMYVGQIRASYAALVAAFGPSQVWDEFKSDAEWQVDLGDLGAAFVYNYANGRNYLGPKAPPVEEITEWHIGGITSAVIPPILDRLEPHLRNAA